MLNRYSIKYIGEILMVKAAIQERSPKVGYSGSIQIIETGMCIFRAGQIHPGYPGEEYISGDYAHVNLWDNLRRLNLIPDKWRDKEYEYVPRAE